MLKKKGKKILKENLRGGVVRIIVIGSRIFVSKVKDVEFIRIKSANKFKFKSTDIVIVFSDKESIKTGIICYFSETEPINNRFKPSLTSIDSDEINKLKIKEFLSLF